MLNVKATKRGVLFSSNVESANSSNNNDDDDDAYRYGGSSAMDLDFDKPLRPRFRQSIPVCEADGSCAYRYDNGHCQLGESLDCECDGFDSSGGSCSPLTVNVSCRAVARPSDCGLGYQYQIIDIKTFPETGLLCCPPCNNPCPLDLDSLSTNEEEPPEYLPTRSRLPVTRTSSYSRNALSNRVLNPPKPSVRRRRGSGSAALAKSKELSQVQKPPRSKELSQVQKPPSSSRTRSSYTRSTDEPSQSQTSTELTESQTLSSSLTKSRESSDSFDAEEIAEAESEELNENENNIGSEAETGDSDLADNRGLELEVPDERIVDDGYSDADENDLPVGKYSSEESKSAMLDTIQSQSRFKTSKLQSGSQSFSKSSNLGQLSRKSSRTSLGLKSLSKLQASELNEVVLNKVDYRGMSSFPRLKSQPNKRSSSMAATAGSYSAIDRHQSKMMKCLHNLYCRRELTDVCIQVGCNCFSAHRVVLSCYSKYFASRLLQKSCCPLKNTIVLEGNISPKTFSAILDFMYTGECQIDRGNLAKMFTAADFLEINSLKVRCESLISGFKEGSTASKSKQLEKQWQQVARNFRVITKTDQFLNLSPDCIQKLLRRDDLAIDSEMEVARAAVRWLNFDREKRKKWARSIMSCIRFKDLGPEELVRLTYTHQALLADNSIKEAILEANWYHTCQQRENACKLTVD